MFHRLQRSATARVGVTVMLLPLALVVSACSWSERGADAEETVDGITELAAGESISLSPTEQEFSVTERPEPIAEPTPCTDVLLLSVRGTNEPDRRSLPFSVIRIIDEMLVDEDSAEAAPEDEHVDGAHRDASAQGNRKSSRSPKVDTVELDYPASTDMQHSGTLGVRTLIDTLNVQADQCPDQRFAIIGYSQGAMLTGDALSASEHRTVGRGVGVVSDAAADRIAAVVLFADPRFDSTEPYAVGEYDSPVQGLLPRPAGSLGDVAERTRSYCDASDFVCASGTFNEDGHISYFTNGDRERSAAFVAQRLTTALFADS